MGVRNDGITLVDDVNGGGGTPVSITSPIGQDTMANSVSVAIASNQSPVPITSGAPLDVNIISPIGPDNKANSIPITLATDEDPIDVSLAPTANLLLDSTTVGPGSFIQLDIPLPAGYQSILIKVTADNIDGVIEFYSDFVPGVRVKVLAIQSGVYINQVEYTSIGATDPSIFILPNFSPGTLTLSAQNLSGAGDMDIEVYACGAAFATNPLTYTELMSAPIPVKGVEPNTPVLGTEFLFPMGARDINLGNWTNLEAYQTDPLGFEMGLIVRNIPSGTQNVSVSGIVDVSGSIVDPEASIVPADYDIGADPFSGFAVLTQSPEGFLRTLGAGLVSDTPSTYEPGDTKPLSLTTEGRLRVSSVDAYIDRVWQNTFNNPWYNSEPQEMNPTFGSGASVSYV